MDDTAPFNTLGVYAKSTMIALQELQSAGWQPVDDGVVRLLLVERAKVNAQGAHFGNALQATCIEGLLLIIIE
ncbi:hypothetical protein N7519_008605 [Penicillium mononematosum]|uniref:uncharacterized protein n=1 Tax=Penicillium mononematosum TaxID=268346 RepID=UPI002547EA77|nr:uncharacterized protein N7519_008605 [Penicillium mononematosum]KAJ6178144.1 hypothetical protein N7519_008605 [Penicillium mononematosum]